MRRLQPTLLVALLTALLIAGCDSISEESTGEEHTGTYPTTLTPLPADRLNALRQEFDDLNDGNVCTPLNQYGFTELDLGPCIDSGRTYVDLDAAVGEEEVVEIAKAFLAKNAEFTGVYDVSEARVRRAVIHDREGGTRHALVSFQNQRYEGMEVKYTGIKLDIDGSGVYIAGGNWYPEIFIPAEDRISKTEAQERLIGEVIRYSDWTGAKTYTVTGESFWEEAEIEKVILPIEKEDAIELRVTWKIGVAYNHGNPLWYVYVDTMTGERLETAMQIDF